ncbi:MAG: LytTR family DNA-binding domain-containing protein [Bergeyella sp.]
MIKAIALDDELLALKVIENYCSRIPDLQLEKTFHKQSDALKYLNKFPVDLLFLDIQMPQKNGLDFYKSIDQNTKVIFTTAFSEYAVDAFEINAVDYLLKPFSFERFLKAVEKAREIPKDSASDTLFIRADYKLHKINFQDILFVEALDDYIKIHLSDGTKITTRMTMKNIQETLPSSHFVRVHRSFILSIKNIRQITNKTIKIGDFIIPIGEKYKQEIGKFIVKN